VAQVKGSTRSYFHKDHLGSSTVMTNASGLEVESTDYMPFGGIRNHTGTNTSNYKFTDQELDAENGLYNYNARLYDPIIGRFISADPIVPEPYNPQSLNRYSYCLNNPLIYTDPSGHNVLSWITEEWRKILDWLGCESFGTEEKKDPQETQKTQNQEETKKPEFTLEEITVTAKKVSNQNTPTTLLVGNWVGGGGSGGSLSLEQTEKLVEANNNSGLSDELVTCLIYRESTFNPNAQNPKSSARGLMQMTKAASKDVGANHSDLYNPEKNIKAGTSYLALRVKWAGGDITKGLEGYGTGKGYADGIIKCEECLKLNCGDNQSCLNNAKE
jgi:RHS repeat-associated protein